MNPRALIRIAGHLLGEFRASGLPADRAADHFFRLRRFLGARDRRFVAGAFFQILRHLRRFDEALADAFADLWPGTPLEHAGYPVSHPAAAPRWHRPPAHHVFPDGLQVGNPEPREEWIDTARAALAAIELEHVAADVAVPELVDLWSRAANTQSGLKAPGSPAPPRLSPEAEIVRHRFTRTLETAAAFATDTGESNAARALSFPSWLWPHLAPDLPHDERVTLGRSLAEPAPVTLRVNTLRCSVDEARAALERAGIAFRLGPWSDTALILDARITPETLPHFDDGWFEFQDEASQLCSVYAAPEPGSTVLDACAGSGGKTLHLAARMHNRGRILSSDLAPSRLDQLDRRRRRAGVSIIEPYRLDPDGEPPADLRRADLVLIDAPCSGTGTLRRAPDLRWRLAPGHLEQRCADQARLLERWSGFVAPGGVLVYATCSLTAEENHVQVGRFLSSHPEFQREDETSRAAFGDKTGFLLDGRGDLVLYPHRHGCDGFFAARLRRCS